MKNSKNYQFLLNDLTYIKGVCNKTRHLLKKKQLSVDVEEGILTISGDKHSSFDAKDAKVIRRELKQSSFKRQFELGELLDGENIKASFKDGILSVEIPKIEPEKPKKHSVKIG